MNWERLDRLLDELLDLAEPERAARLAELEREEPRAAEWLRDALGPTRADTGLDPVGVRFGALVEAVAEAAEPGPPDAEPPLPEAVGPWRPVARIASGGMGDVWLVRRADGQYEATAALKRLRGHLDSPAARERFLRERQLLADLRHPHIATLLDVGVDASGAPYFVLEYVDGEPLCAHCDAHRASVADRIALFEQVTDAVAAAHRRLVVHRDLKPDNILVTTTGVVKLVDFGIAKLLGDAREARATSTIERLLTPRYAAPEQLAGGEITTATDVYALGVVLFELLAGCRPHDDQAVRAALASGRPLPDPPRMSAALARLDPAAVDGIAARRGTTPSMLIRQLRGDLDEIVAKSQRPEPADRYGSVGSFADDLRRARQSRPIEAHRGSWAYRGRKLWARHRLLASALLLVLAALATGLSVALVQTRAAHDAESRAAAINRFLTDELLGSADPAVARGRDLTVSEVLERASRTVGHAFAREPRVEASVRRTLGMLAARVGDLEDAAEQLAAARALLGRARSDPAEEARLAMVAAELALARGRYDLARSEIDSAVGGFVRALGESSEETLAARIQAGRIRREDGDVLVAERDLRRLVDRLRRETPRRESLLASARVQLASALTAQGRRDEALAELLEALRHQESALGADHPDLALTLQEIAHIRAWIGQHGEAEAAARRALALDQSVFGREHWRSLRSVNFLTEVLWRAGRLEEAWQAGVEGLAAASSFDASHPELARLHNRLAVVATRRNDPAAAERHYRAALAAAERGLGPAGDLTMLIRRNFSNFLASRGHSAESLRLARVVRDLGLEAAASETPDAMYLASVAWFLARAELAAARELDTALALAERAVEVSRGRWYYPWVALSEIRFRRGDLAGAIDAELRAVALPDGLHLAGEERYLVDLFQRANDLAGAEAFLREHLVRREAARPPDDPLLGHTRALLGRVLLAAGRAHEAEVELSAARAQFDRQLGPDHEWRVGLLADFGALLAAAGSIGEAVAALEEADRLAERATGAWVSAERSSIRERLTALRGAEPRGGGVSLPATARGAGAATPAP